MKLMNKKSELDSLFDQILDLEDRQAETKEKLEKVKQDLQSHIEGEIAAGKEVTDHTKLSQKIVETEAQCAALEKLIEKKKEQAAGFIRKELPGFRKRRAKVEEEILEIQRQRDTNLVRDLSDVCHRYGLTHEWSSAQNKGHITIPSVTISPDEINTIEASVRKKARPISMEQKKAEKLRQEALELDMYDEPGDLGVKAGLMYKRRERVK